MASGRFQRRINRILDQIEDAADLRDWVAVRQGAQDVLVFDPENADALTFLAAAERALNTGPSGSSVQNPDSPTTEPLSPVATPEAERRQLTVMFCDLQGSTAISQQLDPEELRDVIRSYQELCAGAVSRFDGHIAKYLGDGLLIYFGYPQAHEDDPQRAVRGGLAILEGMGPLNSRLKADNDIELAVRIGVHTGLVVAGEMGGGDTIESLAIVGETPNIAARLQEVAEPNSVVISDVTANLVQGFFVSKGLGFHELRGISEPMELFAVQSESGAQTRFDVSAASHLTPLVGREQELGLLLDRWEQAKEGLGQVVLLSGEPGIGKSRLVDALTERLSTEPHALRRLRCSAYHQNSALHPVLEYLEGWLGFGWADSAEVRVGKLETALAQVDFPLAEGVTLLSGLLSVPLTQRFHALAMGPEVQIERTRELLVALLLDSAEDQPVFLVVEDLQWADPSTLGMLGFLLDQVPTANVLVLLSYRSEFTPPWSSRSYVTPMMLSRLTRRLAGEMVHRLTSGKTLPEEVLGQVAAKSDGVPIFVEELTRMLLESGLLEEAGDHYELTGPLTALAIPSTLQDSLTARLDRLSSAREVAQLGAVLGREFTYELIRAVSPLDEESLGSRLQQLVDAEFLYQRGLPPDANYTFQHALIQDAAYESLLRSNRQQYHRQAAEAMEDGFADAVETHPELLANHFDEAGLAERAANYWLRAGQRTLAIYAFEEALAHFERGLVARDITLSGTEAAPDEEAAALLFGLARTQSAIGFGDKLLQAFAALKRAFEYYAEAGNVALAVAAAEFPMAPAPARIPGIADLIAKALTLVPADSHEAGRLLSRYGGILGLAEGDYEGAQKALGRAITIAMREGDVPLEVQTLTYAADVSGQHLHWQESVDHGLRAIELGTGDENPLSEVLSRFWTVVGLLQLGDLDTARRHVLFLRELAERRDTTRLLASLSFVPITTLECLQADWDAGREHSDRGLEVSPLFSQQLLLRVLLEYQTGDFVQGDVYLERLLEAMLRVGAGRSTALGRPALGITTIARITGVLDHLGIAEGAANDVLSEHPVTPFVAMTARAGLALLAVLKGDRSAAEEHYAYLAGQRGTMIWTESSVDRLLGLLSQTMGNLNQAATHFEDALAFCRKAGYRPELAWTCCDYADMLGERDVDGDRAKAISLMDESLAISRELGMRPLTERVLSRQDIQQA